jgi:regulatory protein RepA
MSDYLERVRTNAPPAMLALPVWLAWRSVPTPGEKPRKVPFYCDGAPRHGTLDAPEDRARLLTFDQAAETFDPARFTGLGVALGAVPGEELVLAGIDLDDIAADDPRTLEVLGAADSYAETSPSGAGLKVFGTGAIGTTKAQRDGAGLEIYSGARYFTVTGERVNGAHLADLTDAANVARKLWQADKAQERTQERTESTDGTLHKGGRNNTLTALAGAMRRKGASPESIAAGLLAENAERCSPPLPEAEVIGIARSVGRYAPQDAPARDPVQRFNRLAARVGMETFDCPPAPPESIVHGYLPRTVGAKVGAGGGGKSTLDLYEAVHIALGRPLYGLEVMRPGPVLILTAEDAREIALWRLYRLAEDMQLSRPEREHIAEHVHIEDATRYPCRFVDVDQGGRLVRTAVLDELAEEYAEAKLSAIFADPQNAFGPGERFVNDGEAELMRAGAVLSARLNCAVRFVHHVGKGNARAGITDQYAGRGGSAGADNARFVHILATHLADGEGYTAPTDANSQDMAEGRLLRLHIAKLSHGKRPAAPIWLQRQGFTFEHLRPTASDPETVQRERLRTLWQFVRDQAAQGIRHTGRTLEDRRTDLGMTRNTLRAVLHVALERRHLIELELPAGERRGGRQNHLSIGAMP